MSILKWQVNSFLNFSSFFISITHNSLVNFKLIHFVLWIKRSHKSPIFETFVCSCENLLNSSCHFPNQVSFFQILHHSLLSWNITPLQFFSFNTTYFTQKQSIKVKHFNNVKCLDKNSGNSYDFWNNKVVFLQVSHHSLVSRDSVLL